MDQFLVVHCAPLVLRCRINQGVQQIPPSLLWLLAEVALFIGPIFSLLFDQIFHVEHDLLDRFERSPVLRIRKITPVSERSKKPLSKYSDSIFEVSHCHIPLSFSPCLHPRNPPFSLCLPISLCNVLPEGDLQENRHNRFLQEPVHVTGRSFHAKNALPQIAAPLRDVTHGSLHLGSCEGFGCKGPSPSPFFVVEPESPVSRKISKHRTEISRAVKQLRSVGENKPGCGEIRRHDDPLGPQPNFECFPKLAAHLLKTQVQSPC
mmetsp:Transcript_16120/g.32651  ORF Transcript_16120/g.32651 Transcript_16120/m.32651 type:complete len:263 (+) Transcript_16120:1166-1954(+)